MALTKVLARDWKLEVENEAGEFVKVGGIETFEFGGGKTDEDTTDFDSDGWAEHIPTLRSRTLTMSGFRLEDTTTGERDPGQEIIDDLANKTGEEGLGNFSLTSPGGTVYEFKGSVEPTGPGGGHTNVTSWGATITVSGKVEITKGTGL